MIIVNLIILVISNEDDHYEFWITNSFVWNIQAFSFQITT